MKRQDVVSIIITFVIGFFGGGYLYVTHFAKLVSPDNVQSAEEASEFTIVGEAYGGCRDVCPSFQLLKDGSYRYQYTPSVGAEKQFKEGNVSSSVKKEILRSLEAKTLVKQSQPVQSTSCNSSTDGIDIRYTITFDGAEYTLDSCKTAVDGEGDVWVALSKVWSQFESPR